MVVMFFVLYVNFETDTEEKAGHKEQMLESKNREPGIDAIKFESPNIDTRWERKYIKHNKTFF